VILFKLEVRKVWTLMVQALHDPTLTGVEGCQTQKARPLLLGQSQSRAVVSFPNKPTGVGALTPAPVTTSTHPGLADTSKLAAPLSLRLPGKARHGADNEHPAV
jgi:hypothetical protein